MSLHDTDFALVAAGDHLPALGEPVTQRPLGVAANDAPQTAIVELAEPDPTASAGRGVVRRGELLVADSLTLGETDQWIVRGSLFQTMAVGLPEGGLVSVFVQRTDDETRSGARQVM